MNSTAFFKSLKTIEVDNTIEFKSSKNKEIIIIIIIIIICDDILG